MAEKTKGPFDEFADTFKGLTNVVTGKIFDKESWLPGSLDPKPEVKTSGAEDDGIEEIEESRTVRRSKRGTFVATPSARKSKGDGDGKSDDGKPPAETGKAPGKQDEEGK